MPLVAAWGEIQMSDEDLATIKEGWERLLKKDEHNAIWPQITTMLYDDIGFRTLREAASTYPDSGLNCPLLMHSLVKGYVLGQGLAIRRLVDRRSDVISLARLLKEIKCKAPLLTREKYVSDAWAADVPEQGRHLRFDRLSGTPNPVSRKPTDTISNGVIGGLEELLEKIDVLWTHKYLAHAADPKAEKDGQNGKKIDFDELAPTLNDIEQAQKRIVLAAEIISFYILCHSQNDIRRSGKSDAFLHFELLIAEPNNSGAKRDASNYFDMLMAERNEWFSAIEDKLRTWTPPSSQ